MTSPAPLGIDLNADLGEIPALVEAGVDDALTACMTSINLACGGHAGDEATMDRLVRVAQRLGVRVGAHPGYPDRAGFGRVAMAMSPEQIRATVREQVAALATVAARHGVPIAHVKPHGALYHAAGHDATVAQAVLRGVRDVPGCERAVLVGQCGSLALATWRLMGAGIAAEAFADRGYEADGTLVGRAKAHSLIEDPAAAAAQAVEIVLHGRVRAVDGTLVALEADTLCIHGDAPGAVERVKAVRAALEGAGVRVG